MDAVSPAYCRQPATQAGTGPLMPGPAKTSGETFEKSASLQEVARKLLAVEPENPTARFVWKDVASPPAVGPDGTLYLAVRGAKSPYEGRLEARSQDGQVLWSLTTRGRCQQTPLLHDGKLTLVLSDPHSVSVFDACTGKPLTERTGLGGPLAAGPSGVFACTPRWRRLGPSNPRQEVVAVDGNWSFRLGVNETLARLEVASDGQLYASTQQGTLYALDPTTGQKVWQVEAPHGRFALARDRVFVASPDGTQVLALDHEGRRQGALEGFREANPCGVSPRGDLLVADRTSGFRTDLRAFDPQGQKLWTNLVQDPRIEEVRFDRQGRALVSSGDFAGRAGRVECFGPAGELLWRSGLHDSPRLSLGPDDDLYALDGSHQLYALDDPVSDGQDSAGPRLVNLGQAVVVGGIRVKKRTPPQGSEHSFPERGKNSGLGPEV